MPGLGCQRRVQLPGREILGLAGIADHGVHSEEFGRHAVGDVVFGRHAGLWPLLLSPSLSGSRIGRTRKLLPCFNRSITLPAEAERSDGACVTDKFLSIASETVRIPLTSYDENVLI